MMDEGRFSISVDVTHQRLGGWLRDRAVIVCHFVGAIG